MARDRRSDENLGDRESLKAARARRDEMRDVILALESALAAPAPGRVDEWVDDVRAALARVRDEVTDHVSATEEPDGFLSQIVEDAPRLASTVARLRADHEAIGEQVRQAQQHLDAGPPAGDDADAWVSETRRCLLELLGSLVRHRQTGADLIYEAYHYDIGGEGG